MRINQTVRDNTLYQYELLVHNSIIPLFQPMNLMLIDVTHIHIQKYYTHLLTRKSKRKNGVSASTVKHHHANISKALNYAVKLNLIAHNPASQADLPKPGKREKTKRECFYTEEQILVLLEALKGTTLYTPVFLSVHLGLRRGEVLGLK